MLEEEAEGEYGVPDESAGLGAHDAHGPREYGEVVVSKRPDLGQFQNNGALPAASQSYNFV